MKFGDRAPGREVDLENLRPKDASQYLGISEPTLARWRRPHNQDLGPKFIRTRTGGCIIYRRADLDAWLEENRADRKG